MPHPANDEAVHETLQMMLRGFDERQISAVIASRFPDRERHEVLRSVMDYLQGLGAADTDVIRGWAIEATRVIYQQLVEVGDYQNALKAIKQIMSLAPKIADVHNTDEANEPEGEGPATEFRKIG